MQLSTHLNRVRSGGLLLLVSTIFPIVVIAYWSTTRPADFAYDDAFITYRYADNLKNGLGLTYNPGEWVLGTTTPLFTLLLAILGLIFSDMVALAHWFGVFCWVFTDLVAMAFFYQLGRPTAGIITGVLLAVQPAIYASLGMETPLVIMLMILVAWSWLGGRKPLTIILSTMLLLTRQDSALWLLVVGLEVWRRERRMPWREGLGTALLSSPWFAFAWWRYGSPFPNSIAAKVGQLDLMPVGGETPFWLDSWRSLAAVSNFPAEIILLLLLLLGTIQILRQERQLWFLLAWLAIYILSYTLLGVADFPWYFTPPVLVMVLIISMGLAMTIEWLKSRNPLNITSVSSSASIKPLSGSRAAQVAGIALMIFLATSFLPAMTDKSVTRGFKGDYKAIGLWLNENAAENAMVATIEIGAIGYYSERPIVDTMGLVTPGMTNHQLGWGETLVYALNTYRPEYVITVPNTAWDALIEKWWFAEIYEPTLNLNQASIFRRLPPVSQAYESDVQAEYQSGLALSQVRFDQQSLEAGRVLSMWIDIEVRTDQPESYHFDIYLVDAQTFERTPPTTIIPFDGGYGSHVWQPGDRLSIPARLQTPGNLAAGTYRLGVAIRQANTNTYLPFLDHAPNSVGEISTGWLRIGRPPVIQADARAEIADLASWQGGLSLQDLVIFDEANDELPVKLTMTSSEPIDRDLTIFVHLVDTDGQLVSQKDRQPLYGRWPTASWLAGEVFEDTFFIPLPQTLSAGGYRLKIGFYDSMGRLLRSDGLNDLWEPADQIILLGGER